MLDRVGPSRENPSYNLCGASLGVASSIFTPITAALTFLPLVVTISINSCISCKVILTSADQSILCYISSCGATPKVLDARAVDFKEGLALLTLDTALDPCQGGFILSSFGTAESASVFSISSADAENFFFFLHQVCSQLNCVRTRERARLDRILKMKTVRMTALMAFCFTICQVCYSQ